MSETEKAEGRNCGSCEWYAFSGQEGPDCRHRGIDLDRCCTPKGPHNCGLWSANDAHRSALANERQALALEEISGALLLLLFDGEEEAETVIDQLQCGACGVRWDQSRNDFEAACPGCRKAYVGDGSGKWIDTEVAE